MTSLPIMNSEEKTTNASENKKITWDIHFNSVTDLSFKNVKSRKKPTKQIWKALPVFYYPPTLSLIYNRRDEKWLSPSFIARHGFLLFQPREILKKKSFSKNSRGYMPKKIWLEIRKGMKKKKNCSPWRNCRLKAIRSNENLWFPCKALVPKQPKSEIQESMPLHAY